jgi:hypothetical protein
MLNIPSFNPSNLFFNCFSVRLSPDFCANLETKFFQPVLVNGPIANFYFFFAGIKQIPQKTITPICLVAHT